MIEPNRPASRINESLPPPGPDQPPDSESVRARHLFLASRRGDLLAPIHAVVEVSQRLRSDPAAQEMAAFLSDIERIHAAACEMLALVEDVLNPDQIDRGVSEQDFEVIRSRVRHEILNKLNPIINYSEMWLEDEEHFVDAYLPDLRLIFESGKRCFSLIDTLLKFSDAESAEVQARPLAELLLGIEKLLPPGRNTHPRRSGRVLVADDSDSNRDILRRHLEMQGHTVVLAADGKEALEIIRSQPLDLVLLDVVMPHVNGFEILAAVKSDPQRRDVPVIMISALEDIEIIARSIEMGADDFLPKPFNSTVLQARIEACLEKRHLREQERVYLAQIQAERQRADDLLHVILPASIVSDLKETGSAISRRYDGIAVLFADIVDFTRYCEREPPDHVVDMLQRLVEQWEESALRYRVQKIKTIGDAFMAACGLFEPVENPVRACVHFGLEMIEATRALAIGWDLRVGIDYGSAVGGVLGHRQYLFDLWGDTVNTASRMESHGVNGSVVVSADAWQRVDSHFLATPFSRTIKGKGEMEVYRVDGVVDRSVDGRTSAVVHNATADIGPAPMK